ncbi:hypothetical protein OSB04_015044 [Centaurea solstitialis]|uniref:Uncharacterized protein n=1 Tax=Centaurea solstitialis TaxID=347529 RepID=A0AA38WIC3_9ASTR|nr:hypothetical protein OSB04_015044 [Centaurea solstitialis]
MASSSSKPADDEVVYMRQSKGDQFKFLIPLIYAPVLPLIRIAFRHKPVLRDRLFIGVLAGACAHGTYLVYPSFPFLLTLRTCLPTADQVLIHSAWPTWSRSASLLTD